MIIVKLIGGIGNQMFQYAVGRCLAVKNKTVLKFDLNYLMDRTPVENYVFRDYDLKIFNIEENIASIEEIEKIKYKPLSIKESIKCIQNALVGKNYHPKRRESKNYIKEPYFHFNENILNLGDNIYLDGYWQSPKYFSKIEDILRKEFSFKFDFPPKVEELSDEIKSGNSVCINARRLEYAENKAVNYYHGCMGQDYFFRGIDYIKEKVKDPHFYVFSDDLWWCRETFKGNEFTIISHDYLGEKCKYYMKLMSECNHTIIPNSSFAWWAAWLNKNPQKIVIAPQKWFNVPERNSKDLLPESWIRL